MLAHLLYLPDTIHLLTYSVVVPVSRQAHSVGLQACCFELVGCPSPRPSSGGQAGSWLRNACRLGLDSQRELRGQAVCPLALVSAARLMLSRFRPCPVRVGRTTRLQRPQAYQCGTRYNPCPFALSVCIRPLAILSVCPFAPEDLSGCTSCGKHPSRIALALSVCSLLLCRIHIYISFSIVSLSTVLRLSMLLGGFIMITVASEGAIWSIP